MDDDTERFQESLAAALTALDDAISVGEDSEPMLAGDLQTARDSVELVLNRLREVTGVV